VKVKQELKNYLKVLKKHFGAQGEVPFYLSPSFVYSFVWVKKLVSISWAREEIEWRGLPLAPSKISPRPLKINCDPFCPSNLSKIN